MNILESVKAEDEEIKNKISMTVLSWLRILLPLILAGLGWYVSQVIAPLEDRIINLEEKQQNLIEYTISDREIHSSNVLRLNKIIKDHESHKNDFIRKNYFDKVLKSVEHDLDVLEDRVYDKSR